MSDSNSDYQLGSADDELARLELQGRALAPATYMIFDAAGIRPGMRVLDLGCGVGMWLSWPPTWLDRMDMWSVSTARRKLSPGPESTPSNVACAGGVL